MTREEAIKWFRESPFYHKNHEPFNMAIKALEQEPCEDAISRQAALDIVDSYTESQSNVEDVTQDIISEIVILPSVNPQEPSDISNDGTLTVNVKDGRKISRVLVCGANHWGGLYYPDEQELKTGHWIYKTMEGQFCSICDEQSVWKFNYCPNCGARMEEQA